MRRGLRGPLRVAYCHLGLWRLPLAAPRADTEAARKPTGSRAVLVLVITQMLRPTSD